MIVPTADQMALIAALGALAGAEPQATRFLAIAAAGLVAGAGLMAIGVALAWWMTPLAALVLGVLVYAGVPLGPAWLPVGVAGGLVAGLGVPVSAPAGETALAVAAALAVLSAVAVVTGWTTRHGGAWACQTARLIGGLVAFAGAGTLFLGGPG